jgi:hypothetical protein
MISGERAGTRSAGRAGSPGAPPLTCVRQRGVCDPEGQVMWEDQTIDGSGLDDPSRPFRCPSNSAPNTLPVNPTHSHREYPTRQDELRPLHIEPDNRQLRRKSYGRAKGAMVDRRAEAAAVSAIASGSQHCTISDISHRIARSESVSTPANSATFRMGAVSVAACRPFSCDTMAELLAPIVRVFRAGKLRFHRTSSHDAEPSRCRYIGSPRAMSLRLGAGHWCDGAEPVVAGGLDWAFF